MKKVKEIIIHCSATRPDWFADRTLETKVEEIRQWHKNEGWADIGYHFVIDRDGKVEKGRPINQKGAHVAGHNVDTIGICLIGGFGVSADDGFEQNYTQAQDDALRELIDELQVSHGKIPVNGHNQYANKACPGFNVPRWFNMSKPRKLYESRTIVGSTIAGSAAIVGETINTVKDSLEPISESIPWIRIVCVALTLIGVGFAIYARYDDWKRGRVE